jgi:hypothetical protein
VAIPTHRKKERRMERNILKRRRRERKYIHWRYNARDEAGVNKVKEKEDNKAERKR